MKGVSTEGKAFLHELLKVDPNKRPSALEALKNKWISKFARVVALDKTYLYDCYTNFMNFSVIK